MQNNPHGLPDRREEIRVPPSTIGTIQDPDPSGDTRYSDRSWTQWHRPSLTAANDNSKKPMMVGLTGKRNVGKSTFADVLVEEFGYNRIHAYESGKEAARAFFAHALRFLPDAADMASRMVYGDLKDKPCPYLPNNAAPRFYMERTGHFHGVEMGVDWTLAMEVRAARMISPLAPIVVESVVYESPWWRAQGGVVVRLARSGFDGPVGVDSDKAQEGLTVDFNYDCTSVAQVEAAARKWARAA